jgi:hypothetical protein
LTIKTLAQKGCTKAEIGRLLQLPEATVRYHLKRMAEGAVDRRCLRSRKAAALSEAIDHWMSSQQDRPLNVAALHGWLIAEQVLAASGTDYPGASPAAVPEPATLALFGMAFGAFGLSRRRRKS